MSRNEIISGISLFITLLLLWMSYLTPVPQANRKAVEDAGFVAVGFITIFSLIKIGIFLIGIVFSS